MSETRDSLRALATAWQRRQQRVPARFGTYDGYFSALAEGLFQATPDVCTIFAAIDSMSDAEARIEWHRLRGEIASAGSVAMPEFVAGRGTERNVASLAIWDATHQQQGDDCE